MELPAVPTEFSSFIAKLNQCSTQSDVLNAVHPYKEYETKLRQIYAQHPDHHAVKKDHLVPVLDNEILLTKARDIDNETDAEKEKYLLPLRDSQRNKHDSLATVPNRKDFRTNFNVFTEQALVDLDWSNVVAAGSSVVTPLLPVKDPNNESKRALRAYYHEQLAPASDVDLFIYGLNEEQAIEKIKQIEARVRDSILAETTTIRTKNAITIVSEYPIRHVQIVLRLYKSITEILTGFDVDCSCVAYDGSQVWASPRALAAFATQQNSVDLTRRSPSYENRLSKYARRGFEVYWPLMDRSRIDPTIYERAFNRVVGLARLLVLEKLPHPSDRDTYLEKRRKEKGRPELPWNARYRHALPGNVKDAQPDDVPDWFEEDEISEYHTFTIPYGPKYTASKIEKLLFKQDLLLNAEWNKSDDRETNLHRHPAFFGSVEDVIQDCCGFCPEPKTDEDLKAREEESRLYISGKLTFVKDNPGRQAIGSFNPLNADDWTDMAYVGNTEKLCGAIVNNDAQAVRDWFGEEGANVNRRDHAGRTPLQLACMSSSPEIVQILIDRGARLVSRVYNGMTALHLAAHRGDVEIVKLILDKSEANEEEESRKEEVRKQARREAQAKPDQDTEMRQTDADNDDNDDDDNDIEMVDNDQDSDVDTRMTEGSFVKVEEQGIANEDEDEDEPDYYDINVLAWDSPLSALHLAIIGGHTKVIEVLVDTYGADVMLPVKLKQQYGQPRAILNLILPLQLPLQQMHQTVSTLLSRGASPAQADANEITNLHYLVGEMKMQILDLLNETHGDTVARIINYLVMSGWQRNVTVDNPLLTAIRVGTPDVVRKVLELGAKPEIDFESYAKRYSQKFEDGEKDPDALRNQYLTNLEQPIITASQNYDMVDIVADLVDAGVDVNTLTTDGHKMVAATQNWYHTEPQSLLDSVRDRIKELNDFKLVEPEAPKKPDSLPDFDGHNAGPYEKWILETNYAQAETIHKEQMENYEKELKEFESRDTKDEVEKAEKLKSMLGRWNALERKLLDAGAKTLKELHPDADNNYQKPNSYGYRQPRSNQNKDKPFVNKVSFQVSDLTDAKRERYIQLFEAVFKGDEETVKKLCIDGESPLQIAVQDSAGFNPFTLASARGHSDLARTVLDIAAAQYQPKDEKAKKYRYMIRRPDDEDYDSEDDDIDDNKEDMNLVRELVDDQYTINDIRTLSENVKSRVSPSEMLEHPCGLWRLVSADDTTAKNLFRPFAIQRHFHAYHEDEKTPWGWFNEMLSRESHRNNFGLLRWAIINDDTSLVQFLLGLRRDLTYHKDDEDDSLHKLQVNENDFNIALRLGRIEIISEIIRQTGAMMPLTKLAEKTGVETEEKPEYYQGLSVYGQKRKDWAQQDQNKKTRNEPANGSPLLAAILSGNIKTVEFFLSETPMRCYEEFLNTFRHDKRIQALDKVKGGVDRALHTWMDTRSYLALHMATMADPKISKPVLKFLIKRLPQFLNSKNINQETPLQLAIKLGNYDAAKDLINAGADQTVRNECRENLLHTIYRNGGDDKFVPTLKELVKMLDPQLVPQLALQRNKSSDDVSRTPLTMFIFERGYTLSENHIRLLETILEISGGKDLDVMDGAGDYLLHALVRGHNPSFPVIKFIASRRPDLLYRENATGMTPIEIAETSFLNHLMSNPPQVKKDGYSYFRGVNDVGSANFLQPKYLPQEKYPALKVYNFLREIADQHPRHRILVSLLDANETARRLAEQQQKQNEEIKRREAQGLLPGGARRHQWRRKSDRVSEDETNLWYGQNQGAQNALVDVSDKDWAPRKW